MSLKKLSFILWLFMNTSRILCNFKYQKGHKKYTASNGPTRHTDCHTDSRALMAFCQNLSCKQKKKTGTENFTWAADGKYRSRNQQFQPYNAKLLPSLCSDYREEINDRKRCETALVFVFTVYRIFFDIVSSESNIKYIDFCSSQL